MRALSTCPEDIQRKVPGRVGIRLGIPLIQPILPKYSLDESMNQHQLIY